MKPVSKSQPLKHYQWEEDCEGWSLLESKEMSIKQERMPPFSSEKWHYHERAQQFFFILKGKALFEIDNKSVELGRGEGLHIKQGKKHRIINMRNEELEFIVCSNPATTSDSVYSEE